MNEPNTIQRSIERELSDLTFKQWMVYVTVTACAGATIVAIAIVLIW